MSNPTMNLSFPQLTMRIFAKDCVRWFRFKYLYFYWYWLRFIQPKRQGARIRQGVSCDMGLHKRMNYICGSTYLGNASRRGIMAFIYYTLFAIIFHLSIQQTTSSRNLPRNHCCPKKSLYCDFDAWISFHKPRTRYISYLVKHEYMDDDVI